MIEREVNGDETLVLLAQRGEKYAFGMLVARYQERLLRYGRRFLGSAEDVEDVVQDVFLRAYQNLQSFDAGQRFSPWIYRIAHNTFVNALRKKTHEPMYVFDLDTVIPHALVDESQDEERRRKEIREILERFLEQISPRYREILVLYYFEELPYADIAEVLKIPVGTVGVRLRRAREALQKIYQTSEQTI